MNEVNKILLLTSKLCPLGTVCPCPGAIYMNKIMKKKRYKIRLQREMFLKLVTNDRSDKMLASNSVPKGVSAPAPGLYICIKSLKNWIKLDFKGIFFFKLVANDRSDRRFLLTSKFCPLGLSAPDLRLYAFIKSWKDVYKVSSWSDSF